MKFITSTSELDSFVSDIIAENAGRFVALDTEFMRVNTYHPQLCLIQIAGIKQHGIIDCLAEDIDLSPLKKLLYCNEITKVLHSARQDLEIFYKLFAAVPYPLFDTQIADSFCGESESIGFEKIVEKILNKPVDKSCQFTNWAGRPLNKEQIQYAINDVLYLYDIYKVLEDKLIKLGRLNWVQEESERQYQAAAFVVDPHSSWKKVKSSERGARLWARIREVAAWRELESQRLNVNRNKVMRDDVLTKICDLSIKQASDLVEVNGLEPRYRNAEHVTIFSAMLEKADQVPLAECPNKFKYSIDHSYKAKLASLVADADNVAKELNIPRSVLASKDDLIKMLVDGKNDKLQSGWRAEVFTKKIFGSTG